MLHALFCAVFIVYACAGWIKKNTLGRALAQIWPRQQIYWRDDALWHISNEWHKSCVLARFIFYCLSCNRPAAELIVWMEFMARRDKKYFINLQPTAICMRATGPIFLRKNLPTFCVGIIFGRLRKLCIRNWRRYTQFWSICEYWFRCVCKFKSAALQPWRLLAIILCLLTKRDTHSQAEHRQKKIKNLFFIVI